MFSILKRNWVDLFCFTNNKTAYDYFPISRARDFIPQWWKDIPINTSNPARENEIQSVSNQVPTMKRCPGIIEYYKKGFMLPLWSDVEIINDNENISFSIVSSAGGNGFDSHLPTQKGGFLSNDIWKHIKIFSPWVFETSEKVDFLYLQPHWNLNELNKDILIPNGHIDFYINHAIEIQLFFNKNTSDTVTTIKAGTPMLHLVPLTDKKIKLHVLYDNSAFDRLADHKISFIGDYYRKLKECQKRNN